MNATNVASLPREIYAPFLWVRRGIPLMSAFIFSLTALLHVAGRGWWLLAAVASISIAWPTFKSGDAYLRSHTSIVRWDGRWTKWFRPVARWMGKEDQWILAFCAWNNHRVKQVFEVRHARRSLILLPHCVQMAKCKAPILDDLQSCYECGLCPVGDYMNGVIENQWDSRITNRSHKAYREAREFRPDLIVAVSCTDRLLKGLIKLPEVPAYVIPLALPHGMCVDTTFSVPHLMSAMSALVEPKPKADIQPLQTEVTA
jgi:hypothetical protein